RGTAGGRWASTTAVGQTTERAGPSVTSAIVSLLLGRGYEGPRPASPQFSRGGESGDGRGIHRIGGRWRPDRRPSWPRTPVHERPHTCAETRRRDRPAHEVSRVALAPVAGAGWCSGRPRGQGRRHR